MSSPAEPTGPEPVDSDVDLHVPRQRRELRDAPWGVLGAVSLGGALGAVARHGMSLALPHAPGAFAWSTLLVNVSGSFLIGVLMVVVGNVGPRARLLRPFLGVGVLGGYTTFSTHILDARAMLSAGASAAGLGYLAGTLLGALAAVWAGIAVSERVVRSRAAATRTGGGGR